SHWRGIIPWEDDLTILPYNSKINILSAQTPEVEGLNQLISGSHHNVNSLFASSSTSFFVAGASFSNCSLWRTFSFCNCSQSVVRSFNCSAKDAFSASYSTRSAAATFSTSAANFHAAESYTTTARYWIKFEYLGGWDHF
ncbi:hypothetical protein GIB67_038107, partial [Kingdonia uniflora]